ncbi:MAG: DUF2868 domain-containing protein [Desulfobulbus sp.]|nr:DUF2868 domain-containing protein [Desulfobulbus sp.]
MSRLWNIADLIDLHFFCRLDEEVQRREGETVLAKRDRVIYLAKIEPQLGKVDEVPPRLLIRKWLAMRRLQFRQEKGREAQVLPGSLWLELSVLGRGLVLLLGVLIGAGAAGSLLLYSGTTPLNVSLYFGFFVLVQLLVVAMQGCFLLYRLLRRLPMESTNLYLLLGRAMVRGMEGLRRKVHRRLSGQRRLDLAALIGGIQQRRELAVLLLWPAFILMQLGGIGFNMGVLGATLSKVIFSDMAFAWQSTLQLSPELVADLARWISLPWSWLVPQACPTLAQIQGSQMVLKEGAAHLATADLVAWWPFLCCSVALYGLLPRCLLLLVGWIKQRQSLESLHFASLNFRPLLQRMTVPRIDTRGVVEPKSGPPRVPPAPDPLSLENEPEAMPSLVEEKVLMQEEPTQLSQGQALILIPEELYEDCPLAELLSMLKQRLPRLSIEPLPYDESGRIERLHLNRQGLPELYLLFEAWQPPLKETETFLRGLRATVGRERPIIILLIGKPTSWTMLTPVDPDQLRIWQMKMQALGDGNLAVQPLIMP